MKTTHRRLAGRHLSTDQREQGATRRRVIAAVAELEAANQHVNGESVGRLADLRKSTASRYLAGLREKGLIAPAVRRPPEICRYSSTQTPDREIAARLKILAAVTKSLGRRPTLDEICATFPE